jgi:hypothetical protein
VKFVASLLSLLLVLTYIVRVPAYAASATFSSDPAGHGSVSGQASVNKIGALLLADASAFLSSTTIEVKSNNSSASDQPLLSGQILQATQAGGHIRGIAFFQGGTKFAQMCTKGGVERLSTTGGDVLEGTIAGVTADGIDITLASGATRHVDGAQLKCVDAGCAFEFDLAANSSKMTFSHCTMPHTVQVKQTSSQAHAQVTSDGVSRTRKIILACVVLTAIAVAIAVPIAVGVSSHHHHHNHNNTQQTELNNLLLLRSRQTSSPSTFNSFSSFP